MNWIAEVFFSFWMVDFNLFVWNSWPWGGCVVKRVWVAICARKHIQKCDKDNEEWRWHWTSRIDKQYLDDPRRVKYHQTLSMIFDQYADERAFVRSCLGMRLAIPVKVFSSCLEKKIDTYIFVYAPFSDRILRKTIVTNSLQWHWKLISEETLE